MTPLDAALYRGFRGCAKFIQLHGGVPACKIADGEALQDAMSRAVSRRTKSSSPAAMGRTSTDEKESQMFADMTSSPEVANQLISALRDNGGSSDSPAVAAELIAALRSA